MCNRPSQSGRRAEHHGHFNGQHRQIGRISFAPRRLGINLSSRSIAKASAVVAALGMAGVACNGSNAMLPAGVDFDKCSNAGGALGSSKKCHCPSCVEFIAPLGLRSWYAPQQGGRPADHVDSRFSVELHAAADLVWLSKRRLAAQLRRELEILVVEETHHRPSDVVGLNEE